MMNVDNNNNLLGASDSQLFLTTNHDQLIMF